MSEGVNVPSDSRFNTEFCEEEVVTNHHVVDHIFVVSTGFIMHAPASIYELKLAVPNKSSY